jgi:SWI/SNF-related matrix-associated actin-dependent regulator 1 of chromatin subfamily A
MELPATPFPPKPCLRLDRDRILILFEYDAVLVGAVRLLPGARWDASKGVWFVPAQMDSLRAAGQFANAHGFFIPDSLRALWRDLRAQARENLTASRAEDAALEVAGLGGELLPFQRAGVAYMTRVKRGWIADEMGLGKTVQALATLQKLGAFPAVIVCPASLKLNWEREALRWLPGKIVHVVHGGAPTRHAHLNILNYDLLSKHLDKLRALGLAAVVFDESHALKNYRAKRTEAAVKLVRGIGVRVLLTGTPILNRPGELLAPLGILGRLNEFGGFHAFAQRYCAAKQKPVGRGRLAMDLSGADHLEELSEKLRATCMIRRLKADVLTELPPKRRTVLPVALTNEAEYRAAEKDVIAWIAERAAADPKFREEILHLPQESQLQLIARRAQEAAMRAMPAEELVKVGALLQIAAKGKLAAVKEWIRSVLEGGEALVCFAEHTAVLDDLAREFDAPAITGATPLARRQEFVDAFQAGKFPLILLNWKAGGVGLTLTRSSNVAAVELPWTPGIMDQGEDRCHRIGQCDTVSAWYFLARGTLDWSVWDLVAGKREIAAQALGDTAVTAD